MLQQGSWAVSSVRLFFLPLFRPEEVMDGGMLGDEGFDGAGNRMRRGTRGNVFLIAVQEPDDAAPRG